MPAKTITAAMYRDRRPAWGVLGTAKSQHATWAETQKEAGLDFQVFKSQLYDALGRPVEAWGTFRWSPEEAASGNAAASRFLGAVGKDYEVIQHADGFAMIDALMDTANGAHYQTAGCFDDGAVIWGLADLGVRIHVGKEESTPYLMFATSHDGSVSWILKACITQIVCWNTLMKAISEKARSAFRLKHTKNVHDRIAEAKIALQAFAGETATIEEKLNFLAGRKMVRESLTAIMDRLFPKPKAVREGEEPAAAAVTRRENILGEILSLYEFNRDNAFPEQRGTAYNLLNAITEWTDHGRGQEKNRAQSALFGSGDAFKVSALDLIIAEAQKLPPMPQSVEVDWADIGLNVQTVS